MSEKSAYALYADPDSAQLAFECFRQAGVADEAITVISSEPFEEHEFSARHKPTWMYWLAAGGGAVGLMFATLLTGFTETAWPIVTSGMPIVALWPNLIVMFELTMLGAVLTTVVTLLITAKLPSGSSKLYDPEVSQGKILVGAENLSESTLKAIEQCLKDGVGGTLKTIP